MKHRNKITTATIIAALLPLGAFGQASSSGQQSGDRNVTYPQTSVGTPTGYQGSAAAGEVKKIKEDKLENKMTAERLIGKDVVDRDGKRIGKVKDVGLSAALPSGFSDEHASSTHSRTNQTAGISGQASSATSPSVGYPGSGTSTGQMNSSGEVELFVSTDGDSLLQVPASLASFDADEDQLKLDIGRDEIDSATEAGERLSSRE